MNRQKILPLLIIALLVLSLIGILFFWNAENSTTVIHKNLDLTATPTGGNFTVKTKDKNISLSDYRGKVVTLYFGYTTCPDICPTSLSLLAQALNQMTEKELLNIQPIFISVDPDRDDVAKLEQYAKYFHPSIIGATAEQNEIDRITKLYGAAYKKVEGDSAAGYLVDHSSYTYIIDKTGKLRESLAHGTSSSEILTVVRQLLAE